ncbi:MAG: hypothetical protein E5V60_00140 [Mesorhizobium sp.]|uniref:hypothetical protein n=1 Tax=Mesorhizobium sp. TaxID=1871066 RepID=UPI000FEA68D8|nr:hypothetical protein [Mesorhizobium sp.]RWP55876.1 MAG: hypothetical protein EOR08_33665 [Mesorhizobium sp.]TIW69498.1 MAG: hypothetical protein E5V60_00140 [Mesorhizobium sp.]
MITLTGNSDEVKVAAAMLPETIFGPVGACRALWENLVQRKSFVTVNARHVAQAIVGAVTPEQIRTSVISLGRYVARRRGRELPSLGELLEG